MWCGGSSSPSSNVKWSAYCQKHVFQNFKTQAEKFPVIDSLATDVHVRVLDFAFFPDLEDKERTYVMIGVTWDGADSAKSHVITANCVRPSYQQLNNLMKAFDQDWNTKTSISPSSSKDGEAFELSFLDSNVAIFDVRQQPFQDGKRVFVVPPQDMDGATCPLHGRNMGFAARLKLSFEHWRSRRHEQPRRLCNGCAAGRMDGTMLAGLFAFSIVAIPAYACLTVAGVVAVGIGALGYAAINVGKAAGGGILGLVKSLGRF